MQIVTGGAQTLAYFEQENDRSACHEMAPPPVPFLQGQRETNQFQFSLKIDNPIDFRRLQAKHCRGLPKPLYSIEINLPPRAFVPDEFYNFGDMEQWYFHCQRMLPRYMHGELHFQFGKRAIELGEFDKGFSTLMTAVTVDPYLIKAWQLLLEKMMVSSLPNSRIRFVLESARRYSLYDPIVAKFYILNARRVMSIEELRVVFKQIVDLHNDLSGVVECYFIMGFAEVFYGDLQFAEDCFAGVPTQDHRYYMESMSVARILMYMSQPNLALQRLEEMSQVESMRTLPVLSLYAQICRFCNYYERLETFMRDLVVVSDLEVQRFTFMGVGQLGQVDKAVKGKESLRQLTKHVHVYSQSRKEGLAEIEGKSFESWALAIEGHFYDAAIVAKEALEYCDLWFEGGRPLDWIAGQLILNFHVLENSLQYDEIMTVFDKHPDLLMSQRTALYYLKMVMRCKSHSYVLPIVRNYLFRFPNCEMGWYLAIQLENFFGNEVILDRAIDAGLRLSSLKGKVHLAIAMRHLNSFDSRYDLIIAKEHLDISMSLCPQFGDVYMVLIKYYCLIGMYSKINDLYRQAASVGIFEGHHMNSLRIGGAGLKMMFDHTATLIRKQSSKVRDMCKSIKRGEHMDSDAYLQGTLLTEQPLTDINSHYPGQMHLKALLDSDFISS